MGLLLLLTSKPARSQAFAVIVAVVVVEVDVALNGGLSVILVPTHSTPQGLGRLGELWDMRLEVLGCPFGFLGLLTQII